MEHLAVPPEERVSEAPEWFLKAVPFPGPVQADPRGRAPSLEPLTPWRRLWPFLRAALGTTGAAAARTWSARWRSSRRGGCCAGCRSGRRRRWSPAAQILVDYDPRLLPFWDDFNALLGALTRLRGHAGLEVFSWRRGPRGLPAPGGAAGRERETGDVYTQPEAGTPLLILSDLGCLGDAGARSAWGSFGRRLTAAGLAPVALMPCPRRCWDPDALRRYYPVVWDRIERLPQRLGVRPRLPPARQSEIPSTDPGAKRLLALLSPAVRVEPALLRAVRLRLPPAWRTWAARRPLGCTRRVEAGCTAFAYSDVGTIEKYREDFRRQPPDSSGSQPSRSSISTNTSRSVVRFEERQVIAELTGERDQEAEGLLGADHPDPGRGGRARPGAAPAHDGLGTPFCRSPARRSMERSRARGGLRPCPERGDQGWKTPPRRRAWTSTSRRGHWTLPPNPGATCYGSTVRRSISIRRGTTERPEAGSPVGEVRAALPVVQIRKQSESDTEEGPWRLVSLDGPEQGAVFPVPEEGRLTLKTDHDTVRIEPMTRPAWAAAMGRDGEGLFVEIGERESARRAYWLNPGPYPVLDRNAAEVGTLSLARGCFLDKAEFDALQRQGFRQPPWASAVGVDEFGLYADFRIEGVTQRMRWIPPGEFLMGSPEDEPERVDNERRHEVVLTHGFWLAETACTQALWEAVMGKNPSRFKGPERPVENVSWDDVQGFIARLNERVPGLELRLPTEAEWEYACRAGTQTPFWFGDNITPEQANYDGNYPYAGGKKGLYREQTVEVKALPANGWGLYQMHGNVWEWCADWFGEYPRRVCHRSQGSTAGRQPRAARRGRRAALGLPNSLVPATACNIGFRLARGQSSQGAEPQSGKEASRAGQTQRSAVGQAGGAPAQALPERTRGFKAL